MRVVTHAACIDFVCLCFVVFVTWFVCYVTSHALNRFGDVGDLHLFRV